MTSLRTKIDKKIDDVCLVRLAKRMKKLVKDKNNMFSMNHWEDERVARKLIRENMDMIAQNAKSRDQKFYIRKNTKFSKNDSIEIQFAETAQFLKRDGSVETRHDFTGNNFIRVTWDATKKFYAPKHEGEDTRDGTGGKKKGKVGKKFRDEK